MNPADLKFDRFEAIMDNWRRWMRGPSLKLDGPKRSAGLSTGGYSQPLEELCEIPDFQDVLKVDALLGDMMRTRHAHYCAIHHAYLQAVFRFRDYQGILDEAKASLRAGLKARGVYLG